MKSGLAEQATLKRNVTVGGMFVLFCFVRAFHPSVIKASITTLPDGSEGYAYDPVGPVILKNFLVCIYAEIAACCIYGRKAWTETWNSTAILVFGINGILFAFDDYLEMQSLGKMHGVAYIILNQSKILITVFLLMPFKGIYQSRLQWILLITLMGAMTLYMCITTSGKKSSSHIPIEAYLFTLMKVTFSCLAAVYTDKYAKAFAKTVALPVQIAQTYFVRTCVALVLSGLTPRIWADGFFHDWDTYTFMVVVSFGIKSSMSFTVLAVLDAILKNIAECVAVLLLFFYEVLAPWTAFEFNLCSFLSVIIILLLILAYVDSQDVVVKSNNVDAQVVNAGT